MRKESSVGWACAKTTNDSKDPAAKQNPIDALDRAPRERCSQAWGGYGKLELPPKILLRLALRGVILGDTLHSTVAYLQTDADLSSFIVGEQNAGLFKCLLYFEDGGEVFFHDAFVLLDQFAVPPCRIHHRAAHRAGDEPAWWKPSASVSSRLSASFD
jgi:hypothetical protein